MAHPAESPLFEHHPFVHPNGFVPTHTGADVTRTVVCLDGLDPTYLDAVETPAWDTLAERGRQGTCKAVVPTLTNVNNAAITTARPPTDHGIPGNTLFDPDTGEREYVRSAEHRQADTWLGDVVADGGSAAAVVVKEKLRDLLFGESVDAASAEEPPARLEEAVGEAPGVYSGEASAWALAAAAHVRETREPDVLYVSTTDVIPHKHEPGTAPAADWVQALDEGLAALARPGDELVVTADHGMSAKSLCVDLPTVLANAGYDAEVVRCIRDAHTYHHRNLGGAAYVHLDGAGEGALDLLADVEGVDAVLDREAAADKYRLPADRIGDALVLGTKESVFGPIGGDAETAVDGDPDATHATVGLRSHGSAHERTVPYVTTTGAALDSTVDAWRAVSGRE
ncbi:hypothetical protein BRC72_12165 [Halobacteriales archaeon QH_7_66_36]|nr:MAG: hypothetical protein BRC72_12165 [Halobacteriales archaeon QH_7_66_36]